MLFPSRRAFLGASFTSLVTSPLLGADKSTETIKKSSDDPAYQPSTLFLTWQRDPTTTMTVQWIGATGESEDMRVSYAVKGAPWQSQPAVVKPYPRTDLKLFRAELTRLSPGSDYQFRIGK